MATRSAFCVVGKRRRRSSQVSFSFAPMFGMIYQLR
jgi:hypothetical protein